MRFNYSVSAVTSGSTKACNLLLYSEYISSKVSLINFTLAEESSNNSGSINSICNCLLVSINSDNFIIKKFKSISVVMSRSSDSSGRVPSSKFTFITNFFMARKYAIRDQEQLHFVTFTVVNWLDALSRPLYKDIIVDSLRYCIQEKGLKLYAYVIMSNHIHLVASAAEGYELSNILRDLKKFTAQQILQSIETQPESRREWLTYLFSYFGKKNTNNRKYQFWNQDNHPIELWSEKVTGQKINYIHNNPVRAGIVAEAEHYVYSSANYYVNETGLLEVVLFT